jgi:SAM-dependent methyltransferase
VTTVTPPSTPGTPPWYSALLRAEEFALRLTIAPRLRARDADVPLGGSSNRVRHPTLGHVAAERLVPGENAPARELEQHVARYAWAFRFCEGRRVVDVGCGAGYGSFLLNWVASEVDGVDRDPLAIEAAKAAFRGPRYAVVDGTGGGLPAADVSVCFEVLEHVDDPSGLLRELLAAAPEVLLSYPNPLLAGPHLNPHHRVDWPLGSLKQAFRTAGARQLELFHQRLSAPAVRSGAPPWAAVWLVRARR